MRPDMERVVSNKSLGEHNTKAYIVCAHTKYQSWTNDRIAQKQLANILFFNYPIALT